VGGEAFDVFAGWLRARSGIALEAGKEYLVEARLTAVAVRFGLRSADEVLRRLREHPTADLELRVVEALTTNETSFFRDWRPFEALRTRLLPEAIARRAADRQLDLWSAACSSGQEAYSLGMLLAEHFPGVCAAAGWRVRIHCTDLSTEMVARTRAGRFTQLEVNRGLPAPLLVKHFVQDGEAWVVQEPLRALIHAQAMNLTVPWPALPTMDVVLMRNVLIYFDVATRTAVLERLRRVLRPGGALFMGSAETTSGLHDGFKKDDVNGAVCFRVV
jgi:chemotaxis protein methyltransferase CheR